jgi:hypothetical protein
MRQRPQVGIVIDLLSDYGDIYVGPYVLSWCNQGDGEWGSFGFSCDGKWEWYMTYYESYDPFSGKLEKDHGFIDWKLCVYNDSVKAWLPAVNWYQLKKFIRKHLRRT